MLITNTPELQGYAVRSMYRNLHAYQVKPCCRWEEQGYRGWSVGIGEAQGGKPCIGSHEIRCAPPPPPPDLNKPTLV